MAASITEANMQKESMKVAIYIRVSTERQYRRGHSFEEQERILRQHCKNYEQEIFDVYGDGGVSGKSTGARSEFLRLMEDAKEYKFEKVLFLEVISLREKHEGFIELD